MDVVNRISVVVIDLTLGLVALALASMASSQRSSSDPAWAGVDVQRPFVLLFHSIECPISDRYVPEIKRLYDTYANGAGIDFRLVFPNRNESDPAIERYVGEWGLIGPVLRDSDGALTRRAGATMTPEVAVFLPAATGPVLVYRGRYDDRYTAPGVSRPQANIRFVHEVLRAVVAGKRPQFLDTQAVGCYIRNESELCGAAVAKDTPERLEVSR